jgi:hypothetical protein
VHQLLDEPLVLSDPIALPLLGVSTEAALRGDPFALNDPMSRGLRGSLVARSLAERLRVLQCVANEPRETSIRGLT